MIRLVQLEDGTIKLVIDYDSSSTQLRRTWYFTECGQSDSNEATVMFAAKIG